MSALGIGTALNVVDGVASTMRQLKGGFDHVSNSVNGRSTVAAGAQTRLNFHVVYGSEMSALAWNHDISQTILRLNIGFWLQAVQSFTQIHGVTLGKHLEPFSTDRNGTLDFILESRSRARAAVESRQPHPSKGYGLSLLKPSMEGSTMSLQVPTDPSNVIDARVVPGIGRLFTLRIAENGQTADILIAARLAEEYQAAENILSVMTANAPMEYDMGERMRMMFGGTLSVADFVTCRDIHRRRIRNQIRDKTKLLARIQSDQLKHTAASLTTGSASFAARSSALVISDTTARNIEARKGFKLSNFDGRQKGIFDETTFQMLIVVHAAAERIELYLDSIRDSSVISLQGMREGNKGTGDSVVDMMRTIMQNNAPKY